MLSFLSVAVLALLPAALAQNLMVNTPPNVIECQPTQISWTGGSAPYFLSLVPAGQTSAPAIKQFSSQTGNSLTWIADLGPGTSFTIVLKDSSGNQGFSDIVTILNGTSTSCVNTSVLESISGSTVATTSGSSNSGTVSAAATTAGASTSAKAASSGTASATGSAASSSSSTKPNGASSNRGNAFAIAGVMGLVGAVLF